MPPRGRALSENGYSARRHEERLARFQNRADEPLSALPQPKRKNNVGEAEVVLGSDLSVPLRKWVAQWLRERPIGALPVGQYATAENTFMGPIDYLAEKSGLNTRRVSGIVNGEFQTVGLGQADALLTAANLSHILDNEIKVWPNPNWSAERWVEYMMERSGCADD